MSRQEPRVSAFDYAPVAPPGESVPPLPARSLPQLSPSPPDDREQAVRMQRFLIATGFYLLALAMVALARRLDYLAPEGVIVAVTLTAIINGAFYVAFRSGLNRKASDPSLTIPQMLAAILIIMVIGYYMTAARGTLYLWILVVLLFGVFRLSTLQMLAMAAVALLAHGGLIALLYLYRPQYLNLRLVGMHTVVLVGVLPVYALMAGYVSRLRQRASRNNASLKAALARAEASEASLAEAQHIAHLGSWSYEPERRTAQWSAETYRIFGIDPAKPAPGGEEFVALVHPNDREHYGWLIREALREGREFDCQFRILPTDGNVRWVHAQGRALLGTDGRTSLLRGTLLDITERMAAEDRIRELAHFDSLSGLPNRNLFTQLLSYALAKAAREQRRLALLFIDLDGFKRINDTLGHAAGDRVLAQFARRLRDTLRKSDASARLTTTPGTPARFGGDEFVVLIDDFIEIAALDVVASKVMAATTEPFLLGEKEARVSASIGIAIHPDDGKDADTLLTSADQAMYRAKQAGKNGYAFASAAALRDTG